MDALSLYDDASNGEIVDVDKYNKSMTDIETAINKITQSTTDGDSGAHHVKCAAINGVDGTTVYAKLVALKALIDALVVGAIPVGSVTEDMLAFSIATQAELDALSGTGNTHTVKQAYDLAAGIIAVLTTAGDMFGRDADGLIRIAKGTARQVLGMNADGTTQEYMASLQSLIAAAGDMIYGSAANTPTKKSIGSALQVWRVNSAGTDLEWGDKLTLTTGNGSDTSTSFNNNETKTISIALGLSAKMVRVILHHTGSSLNWKEIVCNSSSHRVMRSSPRSGGSDTVVGDNATAMGFTNGQLATYTNGITFSTARINGTNLELTFVNGSAGTVNINAGWYWEAIG